MNDCKCTITDGGWCEKHNVYKPVHWVHLCRTRENYFIAWEEGRGPGQRRIVAGMPTTKKPKRGIGDRVEKILKTLGITPERYVEVKRLFGLPPTCGCAKRREWLNRVGKWLAGE
jgi:hypothetical protein